MHTNDRPKITATERRTTRGEETPRLRELREREARQRQLLYSTAWHGHAF